MLDTDTKRRIDTARDILVGKVPDPKSQVEQITIALIYKFMDDMDAEAEEFGGKRKFFAGEFARYGWAKLMRSGLGGHETLNLYAEAIAKMPENPGIPPLFRDIFKNAYLPVSRPGDPARLFLKIIDEFTYDHSERLGDAFEYLLSVLGSQGDAGQFRTPRHIIDFMVAIIDPKKTETVLDPACGTAGFLISSYKHILQQNTPNTPCGRGRKGAQHRLLTPDDKGRLAQNFKGYDISPDMVRLSLVNLYLHGFTDPHIVEYDTLTSQDRWNEYADVILANPPFMSPKGGIKPHNRFSVQSQAQRSAVRGLHGRAPHAHRPRRHHRARRRHLPEPDRVYTATQDAGGGVPRRRRLDAGGYVQSLFRRQDLDPDPRQIAGQEDKHHRLFQDRKRRLRPRRPAPRHREERPAAGPSRNRRIPAPPADGEICRTLSLWETRGGQGEGFQPTLGLIVPKEKIAANGDYNLSGERYREGR